MRNNETVCIVCDLDTDLLIDRMGLDGQRFVDDYLHGFNLLYNALREVGKTTILTSLCGLASVIVPHTVLFCQDPESIVEIHCMLENAGDEKFLLDEAAFVWEKADQHLFFQQEKEGVQVMTMEEAMVLRSSCILSSSMYPNTNLFHVAADRHGIPVYHFHPRELAAHGETSIRDTSFFFEMMSMFFGSSQ